MFLREPLREWLWTIAAGLLCLVSARAAEPACAACHPAEAARYGETPMGNSLGPPAPVPAGRIVHERSGSAIRIERRGGEMLHRLTERGLSAEYRIAWQIGAGKLAHSYIVRIGDYLFESPATWYRASGWDLSPGYAPAAALDFDRPINETCLYCHAGAAPFSRPDGRRLASAPLTAITCERCHGPAGEHARNPSASNIVNPAKLGRRARASVCEQCHIEGEARVLNPGKTWRDFRPGEALEQTLSVYVPGGEGRRVRAVSQVEQLAESRCAIGSGGKLWCGSCHDPHGAAAERPRQVRAVCSSCHPRLSRAAHPAAPAECVSCHMPRLPSEYAHVAVTDHRIPRRPARDEAGGAVTSLQAWVEPPPELRRRNFVLANLAAGARQHSAALTEKGLQLLQALPASASADDAELLGAACEALLQERRPGQAAAFCRRAAELQPESADRAMALGIALERGGDLSAAAAELSRATRLDPSLKHAFVELWTVYDRRKKRRELAETADRFLEWNPQNIMFRILHAELRAENPPPPNR